MCFITRAQSLRYDNHGADGKPKGESPKTRIVGVDMSPDGKLALVL